MSADRGRPQRALALAEAVSAEYPGDLELLELRVGLAIDLGDPAAARAVLNARQTSLSGTTEGAMTAATLYARLGADGLARMMWTRSLELAPEHFAAHLALGRSLVVHASDLQDTWRSSAGAVSARASEDASQVPTNLSTLWDKAERHLRRAQELEPARRAPLDGLAELYELKWAHADPATLRPEDRGEYDLDQGRRSAVLAMLDAR